VSFEVVRGGAECSGVFVEVTYAVVTSITENTPYHTGVVIVVDVRTVLAPFIRATNITALLIAQNDIEVHWRHLVFGRLFFDAATFWRAVHATEYCQWWQRT
jgi:hypothetical protein